MIIDDMILSLERKVKSFMDRNPWTDKIPVLRHLYTHAGDLVYFSLGISVLFFVGFVSNVLFPDINY